MVRHMRIDLLSIPMFAAVVTIAVVTMTSPAEARRGGGNFMNSPGYQRALAESRKRYQEQYLQQQQVDRPRARRVKRYSR